MRGWRGWCRTDDPRKAKEALGRAVALNPWDARSWIELGLRAEAEGDGATSEQCLLRAANVDRHVPAAMDAGELLFPARRSAEVLVLGEGTRRRWCMGTPQPVFRLCARVEEDGKLIDRLQIRNPEVQRRRTSPTYWTKTGSI